MTDSKTRNPKLTLEKNPADYLEQEFREGYVFSASDDELRSYLQALSMGKYLLTMSPEQITMYVTIISGIQTERLTRALERRSLIMSWVAIGIAVIATVLSIWIALHVAYQVSPSAAQIAELIELQRQQIELMGELLAN